MSGVFEINLERDGHDQPWGFRLQGGHDVGLPLTIQRILVGTPAEGVLRKGDILCKVSRTDTKGLSHQQAADLFTKAGNQIKVYIKRPGVAGVPLPNTGIPNSPQPAQQAFTGIATNSPARSPAPAAETLLMNLPKSRVSTKTFTASTHQAISTHSSPLSLTIQDQPYRTSPLIQPSAKHNPEIGPGSTSHLKMQADYLTGAKEAQPSPDAQQAKATEFVMKQKVTGTLQHIQNQPASSPIPIAHQRSTPLSGSPSQAVPMQSSPAKPAKQFYNNPINLYSSENVNEVAKMNHMGISGGSVGMVQQASPASPTGLINPNKPQQVLLNPSKEYNPRDSATWLALQETDEKIDPEKVRNYSSLKEHDPVFSEVYSAPKQQQFAPYHKSNSPMPSNQVNQNGPSQLPKARSPAPSGRQNRSPVADFLPPHLGGGLKHTEDTTDSEDAQPSLVMLAALAESKPYDPSSQLDDGIPVYETNSLGERRRITQSASFNKLMMNILGE